MATTNHGSIEFLRFPNPLYPGDTTRMIKKWLRDSWARRKIVELQTAVAGKADTLTPAQAAAINSGITAAIVADYESRISALEARVTALEGGSST